MNKVSMLGPTMAGKYEEYIKVGSKPFFDKFSDKAKDADVQHR